MANNYTNMIIFAEVQFWYYKIHVRGQKIQYSSFKKLRFQKIWDSHFIFLFVIFFFLSSLLLLFYFTILYWFCHTSTWIRHKYTRVPHPEPPSHLPPHTISLGHPSAPALSILYPALNLEWWFISYMILYMFQCHIFENRHWASNPVKLAYRF